MSKFKFLYVYIFSIVTFFCSLNVVYADTNCTYTYAYSKFYYSGKFGSEEVKKEGSGATISFDTSTKVGTVTKRADDKSLFGIIDNSYSFGGSSTLTDWTLDVCPTYIVVHANTTNWKGYSDSPNIQSDFNNISEGSLVSVFVNDNASIDSYTCHYEGFSIVFDEVGKALYSQSEWPNFSYKLDSSLTDYEAEVPGVCENVYTCQTTLVPGSDNLVPGSVNRYNVYSSSIDLESKKSECLNSIITGFSAITDEEWSEEEGDNSACRTYTSYWNLLEDLYIGCSNDTTLASCHSYNNYKTKLKSYCNSIMQYVDYGDGCLDKCFELNTNIDKLEKKENNNTCGFSSRLIIWIGNIIRWMKYLVPVLVIVLGILDFIKALSGDKDDEMKKAQGRFVKRLIAAALIFIIPFVIEFVLDVMGFDRYIEGCGIIDL